MVLGAIMEEFDSDVMDTDSLENEVTFNYTFFLIFVSAGV